MVQSAPTVAQFLTSQEKGLFEIMIESAPGLLAALLAIALYIGLTFLIYYLTTLPLRREMRARFFLAILESGLRRGKSVEETIVQAAQSRDRCLGRKFQDLAGYIQQGTPPALALRWLPGYLPPHVVEMLAVGEEIGDVPRVLPACRKTLTAAKSKTRAAWRYLLIFFIALLAAGSLLRVPSMLATYVYPRLEDLALETAAAEGVETEVPQVIPQLANSALFYVAIRACQVAVLALIVLYVGGPRLQAKLRLKPLADRLALFVPWHRKRLQRDFSAMLAVLLDAGVPEERALELAAKSTANGVFLRRASAAVEALKQGAPLTDAVARLDRTGEFRWRLANACHAKGGFFEALAGWHDALDAKAEQLEQAASHVAMALLVMANGVLVSLIVVSIFQFLSNLTEAQFLW